MPIVAPVHPTIGDHPTFDASLPGLILDPQIGVVCL